LIRRESFLSLLDKEGIFFIPLLDKEGIFFIPLLDKEGLGAVEKTKAGLGLQGNYQKIPIPTLLFSHS